MSCGRVDLEPNELDDNQMQPAQSSSSSKFCLRCRDVPATVVTATTSYCQDCFAKLSNSKFRNAILAPKVAAKIDGRNGTLAVACSGGKASMTMLHLLEDAIRPPPSSKGGSRAIPPAFSKVEIMHVQLEEDDQDELLQQTARRYGFEYTVIRSDDLYKKDSACYNLDVAEIPSASETPANRLHSLDFKPTSKRTLTDAIITAALCQTAASKGHKAILFGETSTRSAARTLSAIACGKGFALGEEVGNDVRLCDGAINLYRPMQAYSNQEVDHLFNIYSLQAKPDIKLTGKAGGIDGLTQGFIEGLEENFPSTVPVVARTTAKIGMRTSADTTLRRCPLCGLPSDTTARSWRAATSISNFEDLNNTSAQKIAEESGLANSLCYGCLVPFQEVQAASQTCGIVELPAYVQQNLQSQTDKGKNRSEDSAGHLRQQIEEFLIADD